jgi:hypothetical protein
MTTRADVVLTALTQMNVRWQHQARLPGIACDCIGLLLIVGLQLGIPEARAAWDDPDLKGYAVSPDPVILLAACDRYLDRVPHSEMGLGDIPAMRFGRFPQHFGIISRVDPFYMVHSSSSTRRVVEHCIDDQVWRPRINRVYRFRGLSA